MVNPIDYTMDVLSPIEGYMQGLKFGEGIQTDRLNRELAQSQEGRAQETFAMAQQDRASSIASAQAAQQNAAAAQAGLVDYVNKLEAGTATPAELRAAMLKFPKMAETFQAFSSSVTSERLNTEITFAKQLAFALRRDPDQAKLLLETRAVAAEASGDQRASDVARAQIIQIDQNPNAVLTQALMPLVTTMTPEDFDNFHTQVLGIGGGGDLPAEVRELQFRADAAGLVEGTPEYRAFMLSGGASTPAEKLGFRAATPEEAAAFGAPSGQIDQDSGRFYPINPPSGMSLTVDEDGNISFVEGPGAGTGEKPFTEGQSKDVVFVTRARGALAEFNPVADKLTSRSEILLDIIPLGLGREYQDPDYQVAQRSGTEFLQAILRKDTGAAITPAEQEEYGKVYLPQPGDSAAILKSRAEARNRAVAALEAGMSSTQMLAVERASGLAPETTATSSAPRLRFDVDGNPIND